MAVCDRRVRHRVPHCGRDERRCGAAAGEAIDNIGLPHVVGSIAGDNTLLLIVDKEENVEEIMSIFNNMLILRNRK